MSFLARITFRPLSALRVYPARPFHSSGLRAALNETDRGENREDLRSEIDHHNKDQLQKQKEGKGHWKGELASQSEQAIKADRDETHASAESISKMQKETAEFAKSQRGDEK